MPPNLPNRPDLSPKLPETDNSELATEDVESILPVGMDTMDDGVKKFFSDISIPTKDGVKQLTVRVAGGDKSILYWKQDLTAGRIALPVMSVNRGSWRFLPERFSTPSLPAYRRFADRDGTKMVLTPREWPCMIEYTLSLWAERKRDIEYINYQIATRFNPLAEWVVEDAYMRGSVQAKLTGISDTSGKDSAADELAKVRYDINISVEGYLPLPGRIVPTVLGDVQALQDMSTGGSYGSIYP